jgi:DNA-binding MarR family transcriptional regulator
MPQLVFAWRARRGGIPEMLKPAGRHGERHIAALISLAIAGPGSVSDLAERLNITKAHASLVVGELAKAGLVERDHAEHDRRLIIVSLSEAAKPAVAQMRESHAAPLLRFLAELDEEQADQFISHLSRLISYLREELPGSH